MRRLPLRDDWADLPDEALLEVRLADLPLGIDEELSGRVAKLNEELESQGLRFPLHCYLSDEWFTPDGATSIAIPFYLAHPRLAKLEESQMLEIEGGDDEWCMRILRHEAGHVIDNAFQLRRRLHRRRTFGLPSVPYPEFYSPKPYSKSYVLHLDSWYAQSHPDEDFAETFAVWLTPTSQWRQRYAGWSALKKLECMDVLMTSIRDRPARVVNPLEVDPIRKLRQTLGQHYRNKRRHYGVDYPNFYDRDLRRLFSASAEYAGNMTAARFLTRIRRQARRLVADWTGIYQYTIDRVIEDMITRCRQLRLRLAVPEERARQEVTVLLTVQVMNYLHGGGYRLSL